MDQHSEYLLELNSKGLALNGADCGITPTPEHVRNAFGRPSRVLPVASEVARNRERWMYDEIGLVALVEQKVLHGVMIFFEKLSRGPLELREARPKQTFLGAIRLGRYRLRHGISFEAALVVETVKFNGFRVMISEHDGRVATCDVAGPLWS
jgi:hypothetical protein